MLHCSLLGDSVLFLRSIDRALRGQVTAPPSSPLVAGCWRWSTSVSNLLILRMPQVMANNINRWFPPGSLLLWSQLTVESIRSRIPYILDQRKACVTVPKAGPMKRWQTYRTSVIPYSLIYVTDKFPCRSARLCGVVIYPFPSSLKGYSSCFFSKTKPQSQRDDMWACSNRGFERGVVHILPGIPLG